MLNISWNFALNDVFKIESSNIIKDFHLYIYIRWGSLSLNQMISKKAGIEAFKKNLARMVCMYGSFNAIGNIIILLTAMEKKTGS
ncbi:MAG: hypothetical protein ACOYO1_01815 [Bacteroidales bacterium]